MRRHLFTIVSALSLLLCVGMVLLWVKSYHLGDSFGWAHTSAQKHLFHSFQVDTLNGCVSFGGFEMRYDADAESHDDIGPFWHGNMSTIAHRGWFASHSFWSRLGFDIYNLVTIGRGGAWTDWGVVLPDWLLVSLLAIAPMASLRRWWTIRRESRSFADLLWALWYPVLTRLSLNRQLNFLNYGYDNGSEGTLPLLKEQDEPDRPCIQLYHRVVSAVVLDGLSVLEVSCGHGGGAAYVAGYMRPLSMHAVDRNARAIALCKRRHRADVLTFSRGDALALEFPDSAFDVVINIEASHCYTDVPRFFSEVRRVLRPGGHFLYADFRQRDPHLGVLDRQIEASGLEVILRTDISPNVVRGMELNTRKYLELIDSLIPKPLRKAAMSFAGVKGSAIYRALKSGESVYLCYHLWKPAEQP